MAIENDQLAMSLHLAVPELAPRSGSGQPAGRVHALEDTIFMDPNARWSASREVYAGEVGDDILSISLLLGAWRLEGQGQRRELHPVR